MNLSTVLHVNGWLMCLIYCPTAIVKQNKHLRRLCHVKYSHRWETLRPHDLTSHQLFGTLPLLPPSFWQLPESKECLGNLTPLSAFMIAMRGSSNEVYFMCPDDVFCNVNESSAPFLSYFRFTKRFNLEYVSVNIYTEL